MGELVVRVPGLCAGTVRAAPGLWEGHIPVAVIMCVTFIFLHLPVGLAHSPCSLHIFFGTNDLDI